jgi:hypothetical protein
MPGSSTTPGRPSACVGALGHIAFHYTDSVGTRNQFSIAAQWLACTFPCRRFADILADACARLGADVVRYSFIVVDLHHLLLAGLPAHLCENHLVVYLRARLIQAILLARIKDSPRLASIILLRTNQFFQRFHTASTLCGHSTLQSGDWPILRSGISANCGSRD